MPGSLSYGDRTGVVQVTDDRRTLPRERIACVACWHASEIEASLLHVRNEDGETTVAPGVRAFDMLSDYLDKGAWITINRNPAYLWAELMISGNGVCFGHGYMFMPGGPWARYVPAQYPYPGTSRPLQGL